MNRLDATPPSAERASVTFARFHPLRSCRQGWCLAVILGLFAVGCAGCRRADYTEQPAKPQPALEPIDGPNVVLITLDTLRADHLGCYGYRAARTPNLDRFAASGVRFTMATTVSNNTLPSHAAMLIGKHPQSFGVPRNGFKLPEGQSTLATLLQARGYDTGAFISAVVLHSSSGLGRGFDTFDETFDTQELDQLQRRAATTTAAAAEWLKARTARPFFLWLHYFDPHYPYTPPEPYDRLFYPEYEGPADGSIEYICGVAGVKGFPKHETTEADLRKLIALYDGEIAYLDAALAPVFEILDEEHHRADTLVIVVADHGESLTEHDYYFDHGEYTYQPSMRVPLLIRPPVHDPRKGVSIVSESVSTIDIFPTVLAQIGLPIPEDTEGVDLTPLCRDTGDWVPQACFGEGCRPWSIEAQNPGAWANLGKHQFVLDYPWKLILTPYKKSVELYRLDSDPGELRNLATAHADVTARLIDELKRWRENAQSTGEQLPDMQRKLRSLGYTGH